MQCKPTDLNSLQKYFNTAVQLGLRLHIVRMYVRVCFIVTLFYENCTIAVVSNTTMLTIV